MAQRFLLIISFILALSSSPTFAYDPSPLQDFCVAVNDPKNSVFVNGKVCKNPNTVTSDDFFTSMLTKPGNTSNPCGFSGVLVTADQLPGLNTLGMSVARLDFAPLGINPPHMHPRATELIIVIEGTIMVGFVSSNPSNPNQKNKLYSKILNPGDVYVNPTGVIRFMFNTGSTKALAYTVFNSQNPGVITVANAIFGSDLPIPSYVLAKAFQVDSNTIKNLQRPHQ